jgi:hypothetical protein
MSRERDRTNNYQRLVIDSTLFTKSEQGKFRLYVIAAEGDKTEYNYFQELILQYVEHFRKNNVRLIALDRPKEEAGHSSPQFVENMLEIFLQNNRPQLASLEGHYELWLIIDTDDYWHRKGAIEKLAQKCADKPLYHLGLSNPCFELWLILHYVELSDPINNYLPNSAEDCNIQEYIETEGFKGRCGLCKQLLPRIHQNQHEPYYQKLIEYLPRAIPRAKQLGDCTPTSSNYPQHVCTNIYKLVEKLTVPPEGSIGQVNI